MKKERERERDRKREREWERFQNRKPYLMKAHGLEAHPLLSLAASKSEKDRTQPDDVSSVMYLPSLTVRSSGIRSSSLLSMILWCGIPIAKLQNYLLTKIPANGIYFKRHFLLQILSLKISIVTAVLLWKVIACVWSF